MICIRRAGRGVMIRGLVISSAALSLLAAVPYIVMTWRGTAKPRVVSWVIW